ncbi:Cytochrome c oxidase subunit 4 [Myotisia sp. PD_48]|nr:Cytochrome c oxidase subunit 4 [Myotisia sp. PD_48]
MFVQRAVATLARRTPVRALAKRSFTSTCVQRELTKSKWDPKPGEPVGKLTAFEDVKSPEDLLPPGGKPGTIPTDLEQATGLERLELLGKMQGIDIFDMKPLDASRLGTVSDPIVVKSAGAEQYVGCTGFPVDSHTVIWLTLSKDRPLERCSECGNCIKMDYTGPEEDAHHDHDHHHLDANAQEPKTMADFVKPEYWYK